MINLPNRRPLIRHTIEYGNSTWTVDVGFDDQWRVCEVFVDGTKGELEGIIDDACVDISKRLQSGHSPQDIAEDHGGSRENPASVVGLVAWIVAGVSSEFQMEKAAE